MEYQEAYEKATELVEKRLSGLTFYRLVWQNSRFVNWCLKRVSNSLVKSREKDIQVIVKELTKKNFPMDWIYRYDEKYYKASVICEKWEFKDFAQEQLEQAEKYHNEKGICPSFSVLVA